MSGRPRTGAIHPFSVTHAFTLNNPVHVWALLHGKKIIENRHCKFQEGWYGVHLALTSDCSIEEELEMKEFGMPSVMDFKKGTIHGLCKIELSVPYEQCKTNRWANGDYKICNIITEVLPFNQQDIKATGNLGVWPLKMSTDFVQECARKEVQNILLTHAIEVLGIVMPSHGKRKQLEQKTEQKTEQKKKLKENDIRVFMKCDMCGGTPCYCVEIYENHNVPQSEWPDHVLEKLQSREREKAKCTEACAS